MTVIEPEREREVERKVETEVETKVETKVETEREGKNNQQDKMEVSPPESPIMRTNRYSINIPQAFSHSPLQRYSSEEPEVRDGKSIKSTRTMSMQRSSLTGSLKERVGRRGNSHVEDNAQDVEVVYTSVEQIDEILKNDSRNSKAALLKKKLKKRTLIPTLKVVDERDYVYVRPKHNVVLQVIPQDEAEAI